jgi:hypothetical protein
VILVVDSSALILLVNPSANPPEDPTTKKPVEHVPERVQHLVSSMSPRDTIIIPAPVLAEALVQAGEGAPEFLASLGGLARIRTRPFGDMAAVETAMMTREAVAAGDKRSGSEAPWQKVKVDRQVIAIARVEGATKIYADDHNLIAFAKRLGMDVVSTWDLPLPERQRDLMTLIEEAGPTVHSEVRADEVSSSQLDDRREREFREWVASEVGLSIDELEDLDFDVDEQVGKDDAVYGHIVTFADDANPAVLAKVAGLQDGRWVSIGFPPEDPEPEEAPED